MTSYTMFYRHYESRRFIMGEHQFLKKMLNLLREDLARLSREEDDITSKMVTLEPHYTEL